MEEFIVKELLKILWMKILIVLLIAIMYGMSWIVVCGIVKLITMSLSLNFTWLIATHCNSLLLIFCLLKFFSNHNTKYVEEPKKEGQ